MRILIQRVSEASVSIGGVVHGAIGAGLVIFVGIEEADGAEDVEWLVQKLIKLRIFADSEGVMNLSAADVGADILVVSQFTLHASTRKGNRPSYIRAARPETAIPLYERFLEVVYQAMEEGAAQQIAGQAADDDRRRGKLASGVFGADMQVALINDGPVTIGMDSKNRE